MAELTTIEGRTRPARINAEIVKILEDMLDAAKTGKIESVVLVVLHADGDVETICPTNDNFHKLLGGISQLQFNMMSAKRAAE